MHTIPAGKFKAECLKIMDEVQRTGRPLVVTKHNIPVVEVIPVEKKRHSLFGRQKGSVEFRGDLTKPIDVSWDAAH